MCSPTFSRRRRPSEFKATLDAAGTFLYLAAAIMFTWRLYYGALEMRQTSEQISAFVFYRWWTIPFDILCMIVLIFAILYTFVHDVADARTGSPAAAPTPEGSARP